MINIRYDLIEKELNRVDNRKYHKLKLSNRFIDNIKNHYKCHEMCEFFYDSEPELSDIEYDMYCDYKFGDNFTEGKYTKEELKYAHDKVVLRYKIHEEKRVEINTWIEPYFKGNWSMSQKFVDDISLGVLKEIQKINVPRKDRLYISKDKDFIRIYFYGRDFMDKDYWFIFERK